jgi:antitoxin (DNA-binding transcriptional repressor) of toxin-antitoxin stability system
MKTMTISAFKAHLSAALRSVRKGGRVVIRDRDTPIAEVVPFDAGKASRPAIRPPSASPFVMPRPTFKIRHDPVQYLLADRNRR